ncbi:hypothetical protein HOY80DRAFT_1031997 [Tuber brumale]|nr:hypothetical protein HOY80DRAFT_1031997 [Tuber brumale]
MHNYIEGLASQRLLEMAILSLWKPDSDKTSDMVGAQGIMRLATQLKLKEYKKVRRGNRMENSDEEESSGNNDFKSSSESDDDMAYKKKSHDYEDDIVYEEVKELRGMLKDLLKSQKAVSTNTGALMTNPNGDIVSLDTYAVNRTYRNYPQPEQQRHSQTCQLPNAELDCRTVQGPLPTVTTLFTFDGVWIWEVPEAEVNDEVLMRFIKNVANNENEDSNSDSFEMEVPIMAGELAYHFSKLPSGFDGENGPATQRPRISGIEEELSEASAVK